MTKWMDAGEDGFEELHLSTQFDRPAVSSPRFPKMPPRLRRVPERNEIEFISNDSGEVLFTLATFRAVDYARELLNAVYETEGAHKHLRNGGSRTPAGG